MPNCSFCGFKEAQKTPLCQACGSLRYPITKARKTNTFSKQDKLKLSAAVAATVITPGSFVFLALVGANRLSTKIKAGKKKNY